MFIMLPVKPKILHQIQHKSSAYSDTVYFLIDQIYGVFSSEWSNISKFPLTSIKILLL